MAVFVNYWRMVPKDTFVSVPRTLVGRSVHCWIPVPVNPVQTMVQFFSSSSAASSVSRVFFFRNLCLYQWNNVSMSLSTWPDRCYLRCPRHPLSKQGAMPDVLHYASIDRLMFQLIKCKQDRKIIKKLIDRHNLEQSMLRSIRIYRCHDGTLLGDDIHVIYSCPTEESRRSELDNQISSSRLA